MARGDAVFMKVNIDILEGERFSHLTGNERDTYLFIFWRLAVKYRQNTFKWNPFVLQMNAKRLGKSRKTVQRHVTKLSNLGLIITNDNETVTVRGVQDCHSKLTWREYEEISPYGATNLPHTGQADFPIRGIGRRETGDGRHSLGTNITNSSYVPLVTERITAAEYKAGLLKTESEIRDVANLIIDRFYPHGCTDTERTKFVNKLRNQIGAYPRVWINEAISATREKQQRIREGTATVFTKGPCSYFLGVLNKKLTEWEAGNDR